MGIKVVSGDISLIVSQGGREADDEDVSNMGASVSYKLPNGMVVGAYTFKSEDDIDTGEEYSVNHYEAIYPIASGLSAVVTVSDFDYEGGTSGNGGADENGTITTLNIKAFLSPRLRIVSSIPDPTGPLIKSTASLRDLP